MLKGIDPACKMPEIHTEPVLGAVRRAKDPKGRAEYSQKGMVTSS